MDKALYLECDCYSPEHLIKVNLLEWSDSKDLYISIQLSDYLNFWQRLKCGILYILGLKPASWDGTMLNKEKTQELITLLQEYVK